MNFSERLDFLKTCDIKAFENKVQLYKNLLEKFNRIHNLTRFKNIDENIVDSLKILDFKDLSFAKNIVDVGSGAGFPVVFLAFVLKAEFYLFEPNAKKAAFLRAVKIECELENLHIFKQKIEECKLEFKAELITSRALMSVNSLMKLCKKLYDEKSIFILWKGSEVYKELENFKDYELYENALRKYCILKAKVALEPL